MTQLEIALEISPVCLPTTKASGTPTGALTDQLAVLLTDQNGNILTDQTGP